MTREARSGGLWVADVIYLGLRQMKDSICAFPSRDSAVVRSRYDGHPARSRGSGRSDPLPDVGPVWPLWPLWPLHVRGSISFLFVHGPRLGSCERGLLSASCKRGQPRWPCVGFCTVASGYQSQMDGLICMHAWICSGSLSLAWPIQRGYWHHFHCSTVPYATSIVRA